MWLIELRNLFPDVIWSGIIASTLTLTGVFLSNRSNTTRLNIQLKHDSTEKQRERLATLRRDVYLRTAEEMTKALTHISTLPQIDTKKINPALELQNFFASAAKLQLVAEPQTALLVNDLVGAYGELFMHLMSKIIPMQNIRIDIEINDDCYNRAQSEVNRILSEQTKLIETLNATQENMAPLTYAFDFHSSQAEKFANARAEAWDKHNKLHIEFCRTLLPELRSIIEKQNTVTIEIRRELGLTANLADFQKQMEVQFIKIDQALNSALDALEENAKT